MEKGISIGIILLFIVTAFSPMVIGFEADDINDEKEELLDELAFCCYDGSGNMTLITESLAGRVIEVDSSGSIVWQKTGLNVPKDAERLSNGNTLITESGMSRVIEVDNGGNITWEKNGLNDPVDAERLRNGNTLITEHIGKKVIEVDSAGNEVWNKTDLYAPKDAERRDNGNTLIVEYTSGRIIEVDNSGNIVWMKTGLDGPVDVEILDIGMLITEYLGGRVIVGGDDGWEITGLNGPVDAERLGNGNILIAEYNGDRIIEVNSSGNIVWEITGLLGPIDAERLNNEPSNAPIIDGPTNGRVGVKYEYTFNSTDDDGVDFWYCVDWGDNSPIEIVWPSNPDSSGVAKANHSWDAKGTYVISARTLDIHGAESKWGYLEVTMPKSKPFNFNFNLLSWLFERFPHAFPIIRQLIGFD